MLTYVRSFYRCAHKNCRSHTHAQIKIGTSQDSKTHKNVNERWLTLNASKLCHNHSYAQRVLTPISFSFVLNKYTKLNIILTNLFSAPFICFRCLFSTFTILNQCNCPLWLCECVGGYVWRRNLRWQSEYISRRRIRFSFNLMWWMSNKETKREKRRTSLCKAIWFWISFSDFSKFICIFFFLQFLFSVRSIFRSSSVHIFHSLTGPLFANHFICFRWWLLSFCCCYCMTATVSLQHPDRKRDPNKKIYLLHFLFILWSRLCRFAGIFSSYTHFQWRVCFSFPLLFSCAKCSLHPLNVVGNNICYTTDNAVRTRTNSKPICICDNVNRASPATFIESSRPITLCI